MEGGGERGGKNILVAREAQGQIRGLRGIKLRGGGGG